MKLLKKYALLLTAALFCLSTLTACGSKNSASSGGMKGGAMAPQAAPGYGISDGAFDEAEDYIEEEAVADMEADPNSVYDRTDVKLIRRASVTVEATDFDAACAALEELTRQVGGYLEDTTLFQGSYGSTYRSADYTVRVPADKYDAFLKGVDGGEAFHVVEKNESTEDVGNDYADTESRLKALTIKRDRLNQLMEQAESMEDIISIENALSETEAAIEMYSSDLTRYDRLISFATIHVSVEKVTSLTDTVEDPFLARFGNAFVEGAREFWDFLQELAIWLAGNIFILAFWVLVVLLLAGLFRWIGRRSSGQNTVSLRRHKEKAPKAPQKPEK